MLDVDPGYIPEPQLRRGIDKAIRVAIDEMAKIGQAHHEVKSLEVLRIVD